MSDESSDILRPGVEIRPKITIEESKFLLQKLYGIYCERSVELNSYDDKNFKIIASEQCDNEYISKVNENGYVFKITNTLDSKKISHIEAQNDTMLFLGKNKVKCPRPVPNKKGEYYSIEKLPKSGDHVVRLLEFLPGKILPDVPPSPELFYDIGKYVAQLNSVLKNFCHKAYTAHRSLWMLESVPEIQQFLYVITDKDDKKLIEEVISEFVSQVIRNIGILEKGVLHGDINEQNIVVRQQENGNWTIDSVIDFGDIHYSCLIFELAIALTYIILHGKDINVAAHTLAGYSTMRIIPQHEFKLLKVCIAARLCQSLVMGIYANLQNPENKYVLATQATGWTILRQLWKEPEEKLYSDWRQIIDTYRYADK